VLLLLVAAGLFVYLHFKVRRLAARRVLRQLEARFAPGPEQDRMRAAFLYNIRPWHSVFRKNPVGWGRSTRKRLHKVVSEANEYVQILNDRFTDPSGQERLQVAEEPSPAVVSTSVEDRPKAMDSG
jgi:hypothetical protein